MASALDLVAGISGTPFDPIGSFTKGREARNHLNDLKRSEEAQPLIGQALQGNQNALKSLATVDPDSYIAVQKHQTDQTAAQNKAKADQIDQISGIINWADTPEKWDRALAHFDKAGIKIAPNERGFESRAMHLAEGQTMKEQLAGGAPKPLGAAGSTASDIVTLNAEAIVSGNQPPDLKNLYRYGAPIKAELQKRGYNLVQAQEDWQAQTKMIATLNGPQQTRLRQATNFAYDSLPIIEDLAKQWDAGGYPLLNKARLAAAKQGALGAEAQTIATQLDTQIADLTSELGTVYKGGNSSTDESLKLAGKNLQADWSKDTLQKNIELVRKNLDIRKNSLNLAVAGVGENRYAPKGELPTGEVESAFSDAKDAIEQGADPEAVKQELLNMGIDPELVDQGLQ